MSTPLDAASLPLRGLHLIEASAGTGKTFTIALLYLRLLLERDTGLRGIAVVTFTDAATRELRRRLRERIDEALHSLRTGKSDDVALESVLAAHRDGGERERIAVERLEAALTGFDEAFVATIHGFCRQLLAENAFESGLPFIELDADTNGEAVQELVRDYWRLTVMADADQAACEAAEKWQGPDKMAAALAKSGALALEADAIDPVDARGWLDRATAMFEAARDEWLATVEDGRAKQAMADLGEAAKGNRVSVSREGFHHPEALAACAEAIAAGGHTLELLAPLHAGRIAEAANSARSKGWKPVGHLAEVATIVQRMFDAADQARRARRALFFTNALAFVRAGLAVRRERLRRYGFDDLIRVLHERLHGADGDALAQVIAQRLPALLVDEFQDTDAAQYAILRRIHRARDDGAMFLIGDPKQAIYRFRGGDVFTYRRAALDAGANAHTLVDNWRSDTCLIDAMNAVFGHADDAFLHDFIRFAPARYPPAKRRAAEPAEAATPLVVWRLPDVVDADGDPRTWKADDFTTRVLAETAREIKRRLIEAHADGTNPSIAVLVNTNKQAAETAATLAQWNIACDYVSDRSVYGSDEAEDVARVLAALAAPGDAGAARAALATELLGEILADLLAARSDLDAWERQLARIGSLRQRWHEAGPFAALADAIQQAAPRLLSRWDGRRRVTNYLHLAEVLQHAAAQRESPEEMQRWLARRRREAAEERGQGAAEALRPADDAGSVQVLTIHRSKGLQFDVVFAPFLARTRWNEPGDEPDAPVSWHDDDGLRVDVGGPEWRRHALVQREEQFAESLRLVYVALTRARHAAYTAWGWVNTGMRKSQTSLIGPLAWLVLRDEAMTKPEDLSGIAVARIDATLAELTRESGDTIAIVPLEPGAPVVDDTPLPGDVVRLERPLFRGRIERRYETLSYSRLFGGSVHAPVADHDEGERIDAPATVADTPSGEGVTIAIWPRGAAFGNCVHEILEKIPFAELAAPGVHAELARIARDHGHDAGELRTVAAMTRTTVTTPLPGEPPFTLAELATGETISELEFLFPLPGARLGALDAILAGHAQHARAPGELARRRHEVAGLMTGFIDLVLRRNGRYYVVDYKTNLLGATAADYAPARLAAAVRAHDYDLQYLIYLVALQRFLRARLGADYAWERHVGGAIYLFVRGLGSGEGHGIHVDCPPRALIDAIDAWCAGGAA